MRFMLGVAAGAAGTMAAMAGLGIAAAVLLARKKPAWPNVAQDLRDREKANQYKADVLAAFRKEATEILRDPKEWLETPNPHLGDRTPGRMIQKGSVNAALLILAAIGKGLGKSMADKNERPTEKHEGSEDADPLEEFRKEAATVMDDPDAWLNAQNAHFGLKTPAEFITMGFGDRVRETIQSMKHGMHS